MLTLAGYQGTFFNPPDDFGVTRVMLELRELLRNGPTVLVTGPAESDGDSIGAALALAVAFTRVSMARVVVAGSPDDRYAHLPGIQDMIPDDQVCGPFDMVVVVDGDRRRLSTWLEPLFAEAPHKVIIDHHASTSPEGYSLPILDASAASTCEMVRAILHAWEIPLTADLASLLYTGIIFDTGGFRHSNTNAATHRLAAELLETGIDHASLHVRTLVERRPCALRLMGRVLDHACFLGGGMVVLGTVSLELSEEMGSTNADCEGIVDLLVYTRGVEVAILIVERQPGLVKLSLRSRGRVNVAHLARSLDPTGGGHARAAGVILRQDLDLVLERLVAVMEQAIQGVEGEVC